MPPIPAFCFRCRILVSSPISVEKGARAKLKGVITTCPNCGGPCEIADGVYSAIHGTVALLSDPAVTRSDLEWLHDAIVASREGRQSTKALAQDIQTQFPELSDYLPRTPEQLQGYLKIILYAIAIILAYNSSPIEVANRAMDAAERDELPSQVAPRPHPPSEKDASTGQETTRKAGRNAPCPCGSGTKFKNCCGK